jgi:hypothetical protein
MHIYSKVGLLFILDGLLKFLGAPEGEVLFSRWIDFLGSYAAALAWAFGVMLIVWVIGLAIPLLIKLVRKSSLDIGKSVGIAVLTAVVNITILDKLYAGSRVDSIFNPLLISVAAYIIARHDTEIKPKRTTEMTGN